MAYTRSILAAAIALAAAAPAQAAQVTDGTSNTMMAAAKTTPVDTRLMEEEGIFYGSR